LWSSFRSVESFWDTTKLGSRVAPHIGARQGLDPVLTRNRLSVLAPIAKQAPAAG